MRVFIDESGDQGFSPNSSPYIVFAMVIFKSKKDAKEMNDVISDLRNNRIKRKEFKFRGTTTNVKDAFFESISNRKFDIRAVVIEKNRFQQEMKLSIKPSLKGQFIYIFGLNILLPSYHLKGARINLDEKADSYLRILMKVQMDAMNEVRKGSIKEYGMKNSENDNLIQLADMVVGAIARSYYPSKSNHDRWRRKLKLKKDEIIEII